MWRWIKFWCSIIESSIWNSIMALPICCVFINIIVFISEKLNLAFVGWWLYVAAYIVILIITISMRFSEVRKEVESNKRFNDEKYSKKNNDLERAHEAKARRQEIEHSNRMRELERSFQNKERSQDEERAKRKRELESEYKEKGKQLDRDYKEKLKYVQGVKDDIDRILESEQPFKSCASFIADIETSCFSEGEKYLRTKRPPAAKAADEVRILKKEARKFRYEHKEMLYKYEFILDAFPEIANYVDDDEDLLSVADMESYEQVEENADKVREFLTADEWNKLSTAERNQMALDRYVERRNKSKWCIGRDYEMACAHHLKNGGYKVNYHGIENGVRDLGRDLIAVNEYETLIVQCKCWSHDKEIRENVIMQLFGTTIGYIAERRSNDIFSEFEKVHSVLMIPEYTRTSDTAKKFAKLLGVKIYVQDDMDFPRIKCNINGDNKIYHLPFDQQYDSAKIEKTGEFYAYTVKEAEDAGFRRALRHHFGG